MGQHKVKSTVQPSVLHQFWFRVGDEHDTAQWWGEVRAKHPREAVEILRQHFHADCPTCSETGYMIARVSVQPSWKGPGVVSFQTQLDLDSLDLYSIKEIDGESVFLEEIDGEVHVMVTEKQGDEYDEYFVTLDDWYDSHRKESA
jgi:hypothetical protein